MKIITVFLIMISIGTSFHSAVSYAANEQESLACSNEKCYTMSENLLLVAGLLGATMAPFFLLPKSSQSFLTKSPGHVALGGFVSNTQMARFGSDFSDILDMSWGLSTNLTLATLKGGDQTLLRYEILTDWSFYQTSDYRWSFNLGLGVEKNLEKNEVLGGPPLGIRWQSHLLGRWIINSTIMGYWFKKPIYRGEVSLIYSNPNRSSFLVGYQLEDNRHQNIVSHYAFVGFLF